MATTTRRLAQVFRLRRKLYYSNSLVPFIGTSPTAERFDEFVDAVWTLLPDPTPESAVRQSLEYLAGQPIDKTALQDMSWRLAGNYERLMDGRPIYPWSVQSEDELVPVQIIEAYPTLTRHGELGTKLLCRVLAGTSCPLILDTAWTRKRAAMRSRALGFSAPWGKYPYQHHMQLVGLRMTVLIEAEKSAGKPYFENSLENEPSAILTHNRKLLKMRLRVKNARGEGFECPEGFEHPCHLCFVGYDKCPAACHPCTYEAKECKRCEKNSWFDPAKPKQKICIDCHFNGILKDKYGG